MASSFSEWWPWARAGSKNIHRWSGLRNIRRDFRNILWAMGRHRRFGRNEGPLHKTVNLYFNRVFSGAAMQYNFVDFVIYTSHFYCSWLIHTVINEIHNVFIRFFLINKNYYWVQYSKRSTDYSNTQNNDCFESASICWTLIV